MPRTSGTVKDFGDLHVFQEARKLVQRVHLLTRTGTLTRDYGLVDQIRRSAVSVLSNIAEGFERQTNAEFVRFLYMAKGSCAELRAQAIVARDATYWNDSEYNEIRDACRRLSAGLSNFITYLERSGVVRRRRPA
jgi:four helix bundle protein